MPTGVPPRLFIRRLVNHQPRPLREQSEGWNTLFVAGALILHDDRIANKKVPVG